METRTHNEVETQILHIPKKIQDDIQDRGFHLYEWISPDEVKLSIQRDFLHTLSFMGIPLAVISVLAGLVSGLNIFVFIATIGTGIFFMFLYLFFLSLRRSSLLSKSAFVIMTDSSISLGGKIHKLSDISGLKKDIDHVSKTFEENLFEESKLSGSRDSLMKEVLSQLFGGYEKILRSGNNFGSRDSEKAVMAIIALYTLYAALMACVYFIGVFFLWILGNVITWLNTQYLLKKGHTVIKINSLFGKLHIASEDINEEKEKLKMLLSQAQENDWKESLLTNINTGIQDINRYAQGAVINVLALRNAIDSSQYSDMFSFQTYNSWIKKQISQPLEQILELLQTNLKVLENSEKDIQEQISNTQKIEYISTLQFQLQRVELQKRETEKYIPMLETSLDKLAS